jgi:hypothetical protein
MPNGMSVREAVEVHRLVIYEAEFADQFFDVGLPEVRATLAGGGFGA